MAIRLLPWASSPTNHRGRHPTQLRDTLGGVVPGAAVEFDPGRLCPDASLNRTVVGGRPAFDLLSADALAPLVGPGGTDEAGRRLASLLATLHAGDPASGLGVEPTPWRRAYLAHWRTISQVWLAGGTTARFGPALADAARRHLDDLGVAGLAVGMAGHPAALPLIGAARSPTGPASRAAVFDFGHTLAKRGVATYHRGRLAALELIEAVPLDARTMAAGEVIDAVRSIVDATLATIDPVDAVVIAVAAYLQAGEPHDHRGGYGALRSHHIGRTVIWVHDGTAAGRAVATGGPTAVVMLGTAIGVGFAPHPRSVRPVAPRLQIQ